MRKDIPYWNPKMETMPREDLRRLQGLKLRAAVGRAWERSPFHRRLFERAGVDPAKVTVKNLDTQVLPAALCGGDIAAFFIWQPVGSRTLEICPDKAHYLADATGYIQGYLVAGARPQWLASPQGKDIATRWLRATTKGRDVAEKDFAAVAAYAKAKLDLSEKATRDQWDTNTRPLAIDKVYYDDFCSLSRWAQKEKATEQPIDFRQLTWPDGSSRPFSRTPRATTR